MTFLNKTIISAVGYIETEERLKVGFVSVQEGGSCDN